MSTFNNDHINIEITEKEHEVRFGYKQFGHSNSLCVTYLFIMCTYSGFELQDWICGSFSTPTIFEFKDHPL